MSCSMQRVLATLTAIKSTALVAAVAGIVGLVLLPSIAHAAIVSQTVTNAGTPPTLDSSFGEFDLAFNFNGANLVRDFVPFTGVASGGTASENFGTVDGINVTGMVPAGTLDNFSFGGDALYGTVIFANNPPAQSPQSLVITGLSAGRIYQVQTLYAYENTLQLVGEITATDGLGNMETDDLIAGAGGSLTEYALVTTVVSGATSVTLDIAKQTSAGAGTLYSGVAIYSIPTVPEPSTLVLAVVGMLGLLGFGRSRKRS